MDTVVNKIFCGRKGGQAAKIEQRPLQQWNKSQQATIFHKFSIRNRALNEPDRIDHYSEAVESDSLRSLAYLLPYVGELWNAYVLFTKKLLNYSLSLSKKYKYPMSLGGLTETPTLSSLKITHLPSLKMWAT